MSRTVTAQRDWTSAQFYAYELVHGSRNGPIVAKTTLYHGGIGGLDVGDILRPPSVTGYLRPQEMCKQVGIDFSLLRRKRTYRGDRVYATRAFDLAMDHAAGITNWMAVTSAADIMPRYGAVYEVEPNSCILELDPPEDGTCCCLKLHPLSEPCSVRAKELRIVRVVVREVEAVGNLHWQRYVRYIREIYGTWREKSGGDWYDGPR
jgi:hypothetical protein